MATTESIEATPSHLDPQGRLAAEVPCIGCAYNLRLQPADGLCPECGHAVAPSVERWLNPLPGLKRARVGAVLGGVVGLMGAVLGVVGLLTMMMQPRGVIPTILLYRLVFLGLPVPGLVATWLLLTPAVRSARNDSPRIWAGVGRLVPILRWVVGVAGIGPPVLTVLSVPAILGYFLPIIWLARRLRDEKLARAGMIILMFQLSIALVQIVFWIVHVVTANGNVTRADGWMIWGIALGIVHLLVEAVSGLWLLRLSRVIRDALPRADA